MSSCPIMHVFTIYNHFNDKSTPYKMVLRTVMIFYLKRMAVPFKLSVLKKTRIWKPFNVLIPLNDAFLFRNKKKENTF